MFVSLLRIQGRHRSCSPSVRPNAWIFKFDNRVDALVESHFREEAVKTCRFFNLKVSMDTEQSKSDLQSFVPFVEV